VSGPAITELEKPVVGTSGTPLRIANASGEAGIWPPLATITVKLARAPTMISQKPGCRRLTINAIRTTVVETTYSDGPSEPTICESGLLKSNAWKASPASAIGQKRTFTVPSPWIFPRVTRPAISPKTTA
jgi:hypothetical protein